MKIIDMLDDIQEGQTYDVAGLEVEIGLRDVVALNALASIYRNLPDGATYAEVEGVLVEAIWWHVTFHVMIHNEEESEGGLK